MVLHWWRLRHRAVIRWRRSLVINAIGATVTGVVAIIIIVTKFDHGAWVVVILVPALVLLLRSIARHYRRVRDQVSAIRITPSVDIQTIALVPVARLDQIALRSILYAETLTPENVIVLHVAADAEDESQFRGEWAAWTLRRSATENTARAADTPGVESTQPAGIPDAAPLSLATIPRLVVIESPYRSLLAPLVSYVEAVRAANASSIVTVVLPEFVPAHWWEYMLHNQTALRLKLALYTQRGVAVTNLPYHLSQ
jgi:hypothetical protein